MFRITREHRWRVFGRARALGLAFAGFALSSCNQVASLQATCKLVIDLDQGSVPSIEQSLQAFADRRHFAVAFMGKMPVPGTDAVGIGRPIIRAFFDTRLKPPQYVVLFYGLPHTQTADEIIGNVKAFAEQASSIPGVSARPVDTLSRRPFNSRGSSCIAEDPADWKGS
jgi:hypothetical protein